jgi:preprotein translocase subunit SecE
MRGPDESAGPDFITSEKNEVKMEYLIVFSVVAIMTSFVWIIARCLRHA